MNIGGETRAQIQLMIQPKNVMLYTLTSVMPMDALQFLIQSWKLIMILR
jgi:hypothetical protein